MSTSSELQAKIRERMHGTGQAYRAARYEVLRQTPPPVGNISGLFPGYRACGGVQGDAAAARNVLAAAGVSGGGRPLSEALVNGLCGGVGFLYAVFEYRGLPPMLSVLMRYDTVPENYIQLGIERAGASARSSETSSATVARKTLDAAIEAKKPALCVIDRAAASYAALPGMLAGMVPCVVGVAGVEGDDLLIDDGALSPRRMSIADFSAARGSYRKGKQRLTVIDGLLPDFDVAEAVREAIVATARRFYDAPFKGFASNFGLAGLTKWQRLLADAKDKAGWQRLFPSGQLAYLALLRTYDGIEYEYTAPAAGRPMYADFLEEAATITGLGELSAAAALFQESGRLWRGLSHLAAHCGDETVTAGCATSDRRGELLDTTNGQSQAALADLWRERTELGKECRLSTTDAVEIYRRLAETVGQIAALEKTAVDNLLAIFPGQQRSAAQPAGN